MLKAEPENFRKIKNRYFRTIARTRFAPHTEFMNDANNTIKTTSAEVTEIYPGSILLIMGALFLVTFRNATGRHTITNGVHGYLPRLDFTLTNMVTGEVTVKKYRTHAVLDVVKLVGGTEVTDDYIQNTLNAAQARAVQGC